jgi:hypothetical protein
MGYKIGRDARTGHFTTVEEAREEKDTHTVEIIEPPKHKGRRS